MKKKIINGILMVALVAATSTSFVSCKDTSEDVKTDLLAQVNAVRADLEPRVKQAETDIANLKGRMDTAEADIDQLQEDVEGIKEDLAALDERVGDLEEATEELEKRMDTVEDRIDAIVDALRNLVTSVNVNATSTNMLANSKLFPGINCQFLGAAYGQATSSFSFPSTDKDDFVSGHGVVLTKNDIKAVDGAIEDYKGYLPVAEEGAGTVYFTINPSNIDAADAEKIALSLVNSQNEASFVELGKIEQDTETVLEWGLTRADGDAFAPKLWKAEAKIDFEKAETLEKAIDPASQVDFNAIKENVRALFTNVYHSAQDANRNNYVETGKEATKTLVKDAAALVATLLQTEFPNMPALALKAEWNDTVGTRSVLSDYSIAATAYKPLSFTFGSELGIDGRQINLDKIDNLVARILNKIRSKITGINVNGIADIELTAAELAKFDKSTTIHVFSAAAGGNVEINTTGTAPAWFNAATDTHTSTAIDADMKDAVNDLLAEVNGNLDAVNAMIDDIKKLQTDATSYVDRAKNFEVRVTNFLETYINKVITKISADGLTRVLEPVMLFQGGNGVARMASGITFKAGEYDLIPTTMTYEVLAPAYKKYVAVIGKDGKVRTAEIKTNGDKGFKKFTVTLEAGDQAIVYDALDFSGKQIAKKYAINVVK